MWRHTVVSLAPMSILTSDGSNYQSFCCLVVVAMAGPRQKERMKHLDKNATFMLGRGDIKSSAALKPKEMGRIVGSMGTRP